MPQPNRAEIARKMRERYGKQSLSTHTGGSKNHMRRRKFRGTNRTSNDFEKRLQSSLSKLGCNTIPGIDEVNLFKDDGTVLHFTKPKVDAEVQSNTFIVSGQFSHSKVEDLLPQILPQLGVDSLAKLKDYASTLEALRPVANDADDDDDVPMLVDEDMNFEQIAASDEKTKVADTDTEVVAETTDASATANADETANANEENTDQNEEKAADDEKENTADITSDCEALNSNLEIFNTSEKRAIQLLLACNQSSMFTEWPAPGTDDNEKKALLAQVLRLDQQYAPGLVAYYNRGQHLLAESFKGTNPYADWIPSVPDGVRLDFNSKEFHEYEAIGKTQYGSVGFVLVAGGLGERLGYHGIKVALPIDITSGQCFVQYYIQFILAMQAEADANLNANANANQNEESNESNAVVLPLAIMTSNDTHQATVELLKANSNFGMAEDQITIVKQELVPTFANNECEFGRVSKYVLGEKPHGHGDVHALLHKHKVAEDWSSKYNTKYIVFFQDTNGVSFRSIPAAVGVSFKQNLAMNSVSVPRTCGEAIGGIAKLTSVSNPEKSLTINVEYNQLRPLLLSTGDNAGDVPDPDTGCSVYPGNVNTFVIRVDTYLKVMTASKGVIPEFVNPKYTDETKTVFKSPTRLECMMQEYPKLLDATEKVGITCVPKWLGFKPVKSNVTDSVAQMAALGTTYCAASGEAGMYFANREILRTYQPQSCAEAEEKKEFAGIPVPFGARVVLLPSFGTTVADIQSKLSGDISISAKSSLILEGKHIQINGLTLDGTLIVRALNGSQITINSLSVVNAGWDFADIDINDNAIEEKYRIRGYQLQENGAQVIEFDDGEEHVINSDDAVVAPDVIVED